MSFVHKGKLHDIKVGNIARLMAGDPLQSPHVFNFCCPDNWPEQKRHFQRYCSGLSEENEARQFSTLL